MKKKRRSVTWNHPDKQWYKRLAKGKIKRINFLSRLHLWLRGLRDGARGYPRPDTGGQYSSPFIQREISDYQTFCARMWSDLQQMEADAFCQLQQLAASLHTAKKELAESRTMLAASCTASVEIQRHKGESHLPDPQVQARRKREQAMARAPLCQKAERLANQVDELTTQLHALYAQLEEDANSVHLLTQTAYSHTLQRITIYWDAALSRLPDNQSVPHAYAYGELVPDAQTIYLEAHKEKMDALFNEIKKEAA